MRDTLFERAQDAVVRSGGMLKAYADERGLRIGVKQVVSSHGVVHLAVNKRFFGKKKKKKKVTSGESNQYITD